MGKLLKGVLSTTQKVVSEVTAGKSVKEVLSSSTEASSVRDNFAIAGNAVLLSLSKAWLGLGILKPAKTPEINRFDTSKMWSIKFGDYFMPLSQTYSVRAKKSFNLSSLVDGIDILQQTRKEAKTIDCTLKISVNSNYGNLTMLKDEGGELYKVTQLQDFLTELYEKDVVFQVDNQTINDTIKVDYVIMSEYRFLPRAGSKVYIFEFSLLEIKFGDNVLTFDETQIQTPVEEL